MKHTKLHAGTDKTLCNKQSSKYVKLINLVTLISQERLKETAVMKN